MDKLKEILAQLTDKDKLELLNFIYFCEEDNERNQ